MFENIISYAYDFNIIVNGALVRELEGTACAFRCCGRMYHILHHSIQYRLNMRIKKCVKKGNFLPTVAEGGREREKKREKRRRKRGEIMKGLKTQVDFSTRVEEPRSLATRFFLDKVIHTVPMCAPS